MLQWCKVWYILFTQMSLEDGVRSGFGVLSCLLETARPILVGDTPLGYLMNLLTFGNFGGSMQLGTNLLLQSLWFE